MSDVHVHQTPEGGGGGGGGFPGFVWAILVLVIVALLAWFIVTRVGGGTERHEIDVDINVPGAVEGGGAAPRAPGN
jgi:hypothetical protein